VVVVVIVTVTVVVANDTMGIAQKDLLDSTVLVVEKQYSSLSGWASIHFRSSCSLMALDNLMPVCYIVDLLDLALQASGVVEEEESFGLGKVQGNCCVEIEDQNTSFSFDNLSIEHCLKVPGVEVGGEVV